MSISQNCATSSVPAPTSSSESRVKPRHEVLDAVFTEFEERSIRWALLRTPEGGLGDPLGDVDLLIHGDDLPGAAAILHQLAFTRVPGRGPSAHFVRYSAPRDEWLWIHVEPEAGFGPGFPLRTVGGRPCLEVTSSIDGIRHLPADAEFWLLLWHCLADKGRVAPHHREALLAGRSKADPGSEVAAMFAAAASRSDLPVRLVHAVESEDWAAVDVFAPGLQVARRRAVAPLPVRAIRRLRRVVDSALHHRQRAAITVAVLGPDGAGKSTLVAGMRATMPLPSVSIYMGLTGGTLRHARRLRLPPLVFAASACIIFSRYLRARYHASRGRLVVFERYTYDAAAPHPYRLARHQKKVRELLGKLCPSPDLVLLLDAPGDVLYARSGEYSAEMLEDWRRHFRAFVARLREGHIIDATQDAAAVRVEAVDRIWRFQTEQWSRRRRKSPNP